MASDTAEHILGSGRNEHLLKSLSLKARAIRGSFWTLGGYGTMQVLRLGGNLVLTRLLVPEMFGLMAQVQIVAQFVKMFSDVGLRGSIVHHDRGDEQRFLDTAWTLQIIRGVILWAVICLLAWPAAVFYGSPKLVWLIPIVGFTVFLTGASSTSLHSLTRNVTPAKTVMLQVATRAVGLVVMVVLAYIYRAVWVLVVGGVVETMLRVSCSHFLVRGYRNRFAWEPEAVRSLLRFGVWILLSTAMTFVVMQGDRVVLAKLLSNAELGVYSIAFFMSMAAVEALQRITRAIMFPVYARLKARPAGELRRHAARMRIVVMALFLPPVCALVVGGDWIIELLYDPRYQAAGWMLQILAVGTIGMVVSQTAEGVLLAMGDSYRMMLLQTARAVLTVAGIAIGGASAGLMGLLMGLSAARLVEYFVLIGFLRRYNMWMPKLDAAAYAVSLLVIGAGLALRSAYGMW